MKLLSAISGLTFALLFALPVEAGPKPAAPQLAGAPVCAKGDPTLAPIATLNFPAVTVNADGTPLTLPVTYSIFMGTAPGAETQIATGQSGSPIVLRTGMQSGTSYYFYVVAVDANGSGLPSNEVCKTFPPSVPGTVTVTIT